MGMFELPESLDEKIELQSQIMNKFSETPYAFLALQLAEISIEAGKQYERLYPETKE
jgi:hypothetical protein